MPDLCKFGLKGRDSARVLAPSHCPTQSALHRNPAPRYNSGNQNRDTPARKVEYQGDHPPPIVRDSFQPGRSEISAAKAILLPADGTPGPSLPESHSGPFCFGLSACAAGRCALAWRRSSQLPPSSRFPKTSLPAAHPRVPLPPQAPFPRWLPRGYHRPRLTPFRD